MPLIKVVFSATPDAVLKRRLTELRPLASLRSANMLSMVTLAVAKGVSGVVGTVTPSFALVGEP